MLYQATRLCREVRLSFGFPHSPQVSSEGTHPAISTIQTVHEQEMQGKSVKLHFTKRNLGLLQHP